MANSTNISIMWFLAFFLIILTKFVEKFRNEFPLTPVLFVGTHIIWGLYGYLLNLSILLSRGKEINLDSFSSGEWIN